MFTVHHGIEASSGHVAVSLSLASPGAALQSAPIRRYLVSPSARTRWTYIERALRALFATLRRSRAVPQLVSALNNDTSADVSQSFADEQPLPTRVP